MLTILRVLAVLVILVLAYKYFIYAYDNYEGFAELIDKYSAPVYDSLVKIYDVCKDIVINIYNGVKGAFKA